MKLIKKIPYIVLFVSLILISSCTTPTPNKIILQRNDLIILPRVQEIYLNNIKFNYVTIDNVNYFTLNSKNYENLSLNINKIIKYSKDIAINIIMYENLIKQSNIEKQSKPK